MLLRILKPLTFFLCLLPIAWCLWQVTLLQQAMPNDLGADPGKAIVHFNGAWTLRFLLLTLLVSPLRKMTGWNFIARIRRMLGLFTFFYASVHLASYYVFLLELRLVDVAIDVIKRPFITVGFLSFILLIPLAISSNRWMIRYLRHRWQLLHRLIYPIAVLAIIHLVWLTRTDYLDAFIYGVIVAALLGYRVYDSRWLKALMRGKPLFYRLKN